MTIKERIIETLICYGAMDPKRIWQKLNGSSYYALNYSTVRARLAELVKEGKVVKVDTNVPGGPALYALPKPEPVQENAGGIEPESWQNVCDPDFDYVTAEGTRVRFLSGDQFIKELFGKLPDFDSSSVRMSTPKPKRLSLWRRFINWLSGKPAYQ